MVPTRNRQPTAWLLVVYKVPSEPASKRVAIWRDLKRTGALSLQQCVSIMPRTDTRVAQLERLRGKIEDAGGDYLCFDLPRLGTADEAKIVNGLNELRDREYAEIVEECETKFVKEIEFERFRQNYTVEEAEEISQDLEKIRQWFARVVERDWFDAPRRPTVEVWIEKCQTLLDAFERDVYERESSPQGAEGSATEVTT